jgi:hypothetical protein
MRSHTIRKQDTLLWQMMEEWLSEQVENGDMIVIHETDCVSNKGGTICNCEPSYCYCKGGDAQ